MIALSSRATRAPEIDVSATRPRHSRVKSSTTTKTRKCRPSVKLSDTKSIDQRMFGPLGSEIGARVPSARLRPPRFLTAFEPVVVKSYAQTMADEARRDGVEHLAQKKATARRHRDMHIFKVGRPTFRQCLQL